MVSGLKGKGVKDLVQYLMEQVFSPEHYLVQYLMEQVSSVFHLSILFVCLAFLNPEDRELH